MNGTVLITGGCGFLGAALARRIAKDGLTLPDGTRLYQPDLVLWDRAGATDPDVPGARVQAVDIADPEQVRAHMPASLGAVYHLAAVVSGQAEADFDLAMSVNLDGTRILMQAAALAAPGCVFVGTSSLAVYGGGPAEPVTEATQIQPQNTYGITKAMAEMLMADYRRRGWLDARTLRLPTITVRPGRPNAAASSFASAIIREPLAGEAAICPVPTDLRLWIASPQAAVNALWHASGVARQDWPAFGALNVPGLTMRVGDMIDALRARAGSQVAGLITHQRDARIAAIVETWPSHFDTSLAQHLGFRADADFDAILDQALRIT